MAASAVSVAVEVLELNNVVFIFELFQDVMAFRV